MTVCKFWREGHCWHGENCWFDHSESSDAENESDCQDPLKPAQNLPVLTISEPSTPAESESIPGTPDTSTVPESAFSLQREYSSTSEAATSSPFQPGSAPATQAIFPPSQYPKTSTIAIEMSTTAVATDPPGQMSPKLETDLVKVQSGADEATMLRKIANLEETVRRLEASSDPQRQSLKNDLLKEELYTLSEKNRELQIDAKSAIASEAKLRVEMGALKDKLEAVERDYAALTEDRDRQREDIQAKYTNSETYLKALKEVGAITAKAIETETQIVTAPRKRSVLDVLASIRGRDKPELDASPPISSVSNSSASPFQPAVAPDSKPSPSPLKPPITPSFGSASPVGGKPFFFDPKKPMLDFGTLSSSTDNSIFRNGPGQPSFGLPPSTSSVPPSPALSEAPTGGKRKVERTEGREEEQAQPGTHATAGSGSGLHKKTKVDRLEQCSEGDGDGDGDEDEDCMVIDTDTKTSA